MRIEYSGTQLEQVLELNKSRPIDSCSRGDWFTVKDCDIVFYIAPDA